MASLSGSLGNAAAGSNAGVKRRGVLRLGTLATAFTGISAISALTANDADAATGDDKSVTEFVATAEKGMALGVATLDIQAKVPYSQIPDLSGLYAAKREFYPEDYGADNTGATDSRSAIQAAVNAARDASGGTVILDGTYRIDASINPCNNVTLQGYGWGRSILKPPTTWSGGSVLEIGGSTGAPIENFTVRDIKIDMSLVPATVQSKALFVTYMRNLRFENNWVLNSTATGIGADFLDKSVIRGNRVEGCGRFAEGQEETKLGCSGIGIGTGAWGDEATLVEGNWVINPVRYGIFVESQGGISTYFTSGVKIINNHITGAYRGIGSDGVAYPHIIGNSIENCQQDGISIYPGNAGGKSYGDKVSDNTVLNAGRHGLYLDMSGAGNGSPAESGKYMIHDNRFIGSGGAGAKIVSSSPLYGVKFGDNLISGSGSIGLDITSGGLTESDILNNRIVNNTGIGFRLLGAQSRVRIKGNRIGDTRTTGRTQTHGIEFSSGYTYVGFEVTDNDVTGNIVANLSIQGKLVSCIVRNNPGHNPQGTDTLAVTASPMSYAAGPTPENLYVIGGTWTTVSLNGTNVATTAPTVIMAQPNDVVVFTFTGAPIAIKRHRL